MNQPSTHRKTITRGRRVLPWAAVAAAALLAAACSGNSSSGPATDASTAAAGGATPPPIVGAPPAGSVTTAAAASAAGVDWPQYDGGAARTGVATGLAPAGALKTAWTAHLDGAVYAQPLVVGGMVIAATEHDSVYALNRRTGAVIWATSIGRPVLSPPPHGCGNIYPLGITGSPIYDRADGEIYAVGETAGYHHMLVALDAKTGAVVLRRYLDLPTPADQAPYNQQRPALAIDHGRAYATFGGLAGDCGPYQGSIVSAPLTGNGPLVIWRTPTRSKGAIWAPGGPVIDAHGNLWVSIGNGAATSGAFDGSDSVTELTPALRRIAFFAPTTWGPDNANDLDLGSTGPALAAGNSVFILGKRGVGYLLNGRHLGGIGGQLAQQPICAAFGTAAVSGSVVYEPCRQGGGMAAVRVSAATKTIKVLWRGPNGVQGTPVVGGGAVWVTDYVRGTLYELNQVTGRVMHQLKLPVRLPTFDSMALSGRTAYVSTLSGVTAVNGA